ncbi:pyridoxal phosphate-dependent decarboxylase family protein [Candidatus Uabimicrobium amorphum]|uniref:L-2,4-diaminobutyrate decarboxylase n=1 Tax=Uabimicrobium amorphum TaxID=2596890 RepID=A0A5S9F7J7_UABAM|nr:aminotransferase class I/II-fold pyridoxal phosphate-dependent enzyme [Candidatus Uabimicrobium amorphum]BBM87789.1 L-2,4-diaminobutyrate decarboxylase [Candidatus Uabimicrobium amorphum]
MSKLQFSREEMKKMGYQVIDMLVDHWDNLPQKRTAITATRQEMRDKISQPFVSEPGNFDDILKMLREDVFGHALNVMHPRFFAYIPGPSNFVSVLADTMAAGYNTFAGTWLAAAGPSQIEWDTIHFLCEQLGLGQEAGGIFVSGGSMANLTALAVARKQVLDDRLHNATVYFSDQTHTATDRALIILGFHRENIRKIPSNDNFVMCTDELRSQIQKDKQNGQRPFCVIANSGTTNTGAIEPLNDIADICEEENMWFHVDGAYGAAAVLSERGKKQLQGIERADSIALDPHKWLFQPFEIGCTIVRNTEHLRDTFQILPEFLQDAHQHDREINFCDHGIQLSRSFRALKLWLSFKVFGLKAFSDAIDMGFDLAEFAAQQVEKNSHLQLVTPAQMALLSFRYYDEGCDEEALNHINNNIVKQVIKEGFAMMSSTVLKGKTVLRLCTINPRSTEDDVCQTLMKVVEYGQGIQKKM